MKPMELLAPAGSPEALQAAVQNGAGAVYLGYGDFNARRGAKNFSKEALAAGVSYCHLRGVKVYLTLNTLVTDRELPQAFETASFAAACGVDAVLVQDIGLLTLLKETVPELPLHASTQMTIHNLPGVFFCQELSLSRVVLSRELSREAIAEICRSTPLEIEVFVHGALCMGYSGQCFFSALLGGRSGNRGLCAQPCRLAYRWQKEQAQGHPLSLKDLSLADYLGELEALGVACLKLEGRMKRPEYAAVVTKIYAEALKQGRAPTGEEQKKLEDAFSRDGFTQGYYLNQKGPAMFGRRREGQQAPEGLFAQARASYEGGEQPRVPITICALVEADSPVYVTVSDEDGHSVTVTGPVPEAARTRDLTEAQVEAQLTKTGGTVFYCIQTSIQVAPGLSLPLSALNALRREALERLSEQRCAVPPRTIRPFTPPERTPNPPGPPAYTVSLRSLAQLSSALLEGAPLRLFLPAEEIAAAPEAVADYMSRYPGTGFAVTLPRVFWDRELPRLRQLLSLCRDLGISEALVGNWGLVPLCREMGFAMRGDFGLGVYNSMALQALKNLDFSSATASFELNFSQVRDLNKTLDTELVAYGRLSMLLTEQGLNIQPGDGAALIDRKGVSFPVLPAWGGRSELLNAKTLYLADRREDYTGLGLWAARLSFTMESAADCAAILRQYQGLAPADAPEDLTRGLYYRKVE